MRIGRKDDPSGLLVKQAAVPSSHLNHLSGLVANAAKLRALPGCRLRGNATGCASGKAANSDHRRRFELLEKLCSDLCTRTDPSFCARELCFDSVPALMGTASRQGWELNCEHLAPIAGASSICVGPLSRRAGNATPPKRKLSGLHYVHVPKTGSSFLNLLFETVCYRTWGDGKTFKNPIDLFSQISGKGNLELFCPGGFSHLDGGGHSGVTSSEWAAHYGSIVGMLRDPLRRHIR